MQKLIDKAKIEHTLSKSEIVDILKEDSINQYLFKSADEVRKNFTGNEVHLRALIEFSNICRCDCKYCGIRRDNKNVSRYRLKKDEILKLADFAVQSGYKTIVLQSGEDMFFTAEYFAEIITAIKKYDVAVTLSIGERSYEEYKVLKDAGADRFLLRIETTDENLYKKMHPGMSFENRKRCLYDLKSLGFETGTGSLVGLPEQTIESLADDILFYKELNADMVGIGPLIVHPETPLKDEKNGDLILAIKVLALTRLLLPDINIPATTAMETLHPQGRIWALQAGANVIMPNVTFEKCRKNYEIYPDKVSVDYSKLERDLKQIGRTISKKHGFRGNSDSPLTRHFVPPSPAGRGKNNNIAKTLRKNVTPQELKFWNIVRNNKFQNLKFKRQYPIGKYIVDFVVIEKMLVIELDGGGHNTNNQQKYDEERTQYLTSRGFKILRFWNDEIDKNIEGVFEKISNVLQKKGE